MQNSHLKLKEIIWEITGACRNGCNYCGSKECWNDPIAEDTIRKIVDRIVEYGGVPAIDISGGDPLLVSLPTHRYIVSNLHKVDTEVKILFNPKSFSKCSPTNFDSRLDILRLYDWIGISINTEEELELFKKSSLPHALAGKFTIITNFNLKNVFIFEKIKSLVSLCKCAWQIQYTMYKNPREDLSIYKDQPACDYLFKQMDDAIRVGIKLVPADDMNNGPCGAGSCSIGILSNGDVVPCLSMRSWVDDIKSLVQGNLLHETLFNIWTNKFFNYRFECFKCCKDICNKPYIPNSTYLNTLFTGNPDQQILYGVFPLPPNDGNPPPNITVYAVTRPPNISMYAVAIPSITVMYAVSTGNDSSNVYKYGITSETYTSETYTNVKPNTPKQWDNAVRYGVNRPNKPKGA